MCDALSAPVCTHGKGDAENRNVTGLTIDLLGWGTPRGVHPCAAHISLHTVDQVLFPPVPPFMLPPGMVPIGRGAKTYTT